MKVFKVIKPLVSYLNDARKSNTTIGLVPTMGALHEGHLSLLKASKKENNLTVCSIYVNPTQFNDKKDLLKYPRNMQKDLELLESVGCDVAFAPADDEMYISKPTLRMNFGYLEQVMEGKFREGHFSGVGLVVSKLFNIVQPDKAYFGQKDLQQYHVIKELVKDLSYPIEIRPIETLREPDGLAKSSRNARLDSQARTKSVILYESLKQAENMLRTGESVGTVKDFFDGKFQQTDNARLEYFEIVNAHDLSPLRNIMDTDRVALCVAAFFGEVRLIDNIIFSAKAKE